MNELVIDEARKRNPLLEPLYIPLGKVFKPVKAKHLNSCKGCYFMKKGKGDCWTGLLKCFPEEREDGQRIIWEVVNER